MSETSDGDNSGSDAALSRRDQLHILAVIAGVVVAAAALTFGLKTLRVNLARDSRAEFALTPGSFRPTQEQMQTLTIVPVQDIAFHNEEVTEGTIAVDDDLVTPVFSPYSGRVTRLTARLGDVVAKGAPLMAVEASEIVQAQADAVSAADATKAAAAQLSVAIENEKRAHDLYDIKGVALRDWQQAQADLAAARAAARNAETQRIASRSRLQIFGKSPQQIDAIVRDGDTGTVGPEAIIAAPIAGTVIQRQVGLGQYIQANAATPVFAIGDLSKVWLVANVREDAAPRMHVGQVAEVRVSAYPDRVFKARLTSVGPMVDAAAHRLPVRAEIDNTDHALTPQMFATFTIDTGDSASAPAVPVNAIVMDGEEARVWIANADGTLALRQIRTGRTYGRMTEVVDGLKAGERVVAAGALFIDRAAQAD